MTQAVRIIVAATLAVQALATAARSESHAPPPVGATGAWRIETSKASESQQDNVALVTPAIDTDATFSLGCKPDVWLYYLAVRDARLTELAAGSEATLSIRYPGEEPTRWQVASRGDGSVVVQEIVQQTAFTAILASLKQTTALTVEFAIDDYRWTFRLDNFSAVLQSLVDACGFPPDPARTSAGQDDKPVPSIDVRQRNQPDLRLLLPRAR
jgi:hypothetical protein